MMFADFFGRKKENSSALEMMMAFILSWERHGEDETAISSSALDLLRTYFGDRPCGVWKKFGDSFQKISERGMTESLARPGGELASLARVYLTGATEFHSVDRENEPFFGDSGFLYIPLKTKEQVKGVLALAASDKEGAAVEFIQPLECLGRLLSLAFQTVDEKEEMGRREKRLQSEVQVTMRELEQTNKRLIERVKELKALFSELENKVQELTKANRAKDEFLSIVSHELRTPLTSLMGFLAVLLEGEAGPINEDQKKFLTIAKQSSDRLKIIISDLLDISRLESGRFAMDMGECSLLKIIQTSVDELKASALMKEIQIRTNATSALPQIWGDQARLEQVLSNLIMNAIKFTPESGIVDVTTSVRSDGVEVTVRDNGPGLAPDQLEKVFDMFYQVDATARRKVGGVGLGLAIARGIISLHGGKIWVESEPGRGSAFKFIIPKSNVQQAA